MKQDPTIYREVTITLDSVFKKYGEKAASAINRYMRIRQETRQKQQRIEELESELGELKKVDSLARRRSRS